MNVLESLLILATTVSALWWAFARHRAPVALERLSLAGLALAVLAVAVEGVHWQLVPWQLLALACAIVALLRRQRLARSRRIVRVLGRAALMLGILAGGLGLLAARVPQLPRPSGPHLVGSVVFHWTDAQRPETFATSASERRQVVAQAWYPTETPGPPVPYFEAQGRLPAYVDPYPAWFYGDFDQVDTHASASPPVSAARPTWPVLLLLPGWGSPREDYSSLCADLASRGYVVIALSHPYESAVSVLADGRVVGTASGASILGANMADMTPIRAADSRFVLDQLGRLAQVEPASPLVGHLDVQHTGIVGHSMGGAAAAQVVAEDPRFLVGVNLDGTLPAVLAGDWHLGAPFLWLQADGQQQASYLQGRDRLLAGVPGSELLVVGGTSHTSFTDLSAYMSPLGRGLTGDDGSQALVAATTGDLIAAFVSAPLAGPGDPMAQVLARHPTVRREQGNAAGPAGGG
jgi:predicted dienelactone hydrolase